jgi:hypothetical protein
MLKFSLLMLLEVMCNPVFALLLKERLLSGDSTQVQVNE